MASSSLFVIIYLLGVAFAVWDHEYPSNFRDLVFTPIDPQISRDGFMVLEEVETPLPAVQLEPSPSSRPFTLSTNQPLSYQQQFKVQIQNQNAYLNDFGLMRVDVGGDGNCLFRSISLALYGNENHHGDLRQTAVEYMFQNVHDFRMFFETDLNLGNNEETISGIQLLSSPSEWAGQESVMALSRALGISIMVTMGGYAHHPRVSTMEHSDINSQGQPVHIIFTMQGGGHYQAIRELSEDFAPMSLDSPYSMPSNVDLGHIYTEWKETAFSRLVLNPKEKTLINKPSKKSLMTQCPVCDRKILKPSMKKHYLRYHSDSSLNVPFKSQPKLKCLVPSCKDQFRTVKYLTEHIKACHTDSIQIKEEDISFKDHNAFLSWKEDEEIHNNVFYKLKRSTTKSKQGQTYQYVCNRDGINVKATNKGKMSRRNLRGTGKCGFCLSRMYVKESREGKVSVNYILTHTNHEISLDQSKFLPKLPKSIRENVKQKLSLGISEKNIISDLTGELGKLDKRSDENVKYYQLIDKQTIRNIKHTANSDNAEDPHDATSAFLYVKKLQSMTNNPILAYKPQFANDPSIALPNEDFLLLLMTKEQRDMYDKFASRTLCVDSTHKTNHYDFKLITLLVVDEYQKGYPVAFCISNRESTDIFYHIFRLIKEKSPNTIPSIIMSDADLAAFNAAQLVFGQNNVIHHLCKWHIFQAWRRRIVTVKNKEHQDEIYKLLDCILEARSLGNFEKYCNILTTKYDNIEPSFMKYFKANYLSNPEKWALCFRPTHLQNEITTNMHLESFHNKLKTLYFKGKQNKRIDKLIDTIIEVEKDYYLNRKRMLTYNSQVDCSNSKFLDKHVSGMSLCGNSVSSVNENAYTIKSSSTINRYYTVRKRTSICNLPSCLMKCNIPPCKNLCQHLYSCSCPDTDNVCKHIHKIHSLFNAIEDSEDVGEEQFTCVNSEINNIQDTNEISRNITLKKIDHSIKLLQSQVTDPKLTVDRLKHIMEELNSITTLNEGITNDLDTIPEPMQPKFKVSSTQKFVKQPTFKSTTKKRTKNKCSLRKPSDQERLDLLSSNPVPSVAPYPPLYLVPRTTTPNITTHATDLFVSSNGSISVPHNFLAPPSTSNQRIPVKMPNGKPFSIIISNRNKSNSTEDILE